eukprot:164066-Amphidinium_carterae.2
MQLCVCVRSFVCLALKFWEPYRSGHHDSILQVDVDVSAWEGPPRAAAKKTDAGSALRTSSRDRSPQQWAHTHQHHVITSLAR